MDSQLSRIEVLADFAIELPSWAFGNSGTRFKVFAQPACRATRSRRSPTRPGAPVHRGGPAVALHIPWDRVDDYAVLASHAADHGMRLGAINSNLFQDDDYKLGSLDHPDAARAGQGDRPSSGSASTSWTPPARGPEALVARRHRTTRARTTSAPARTAWPTRCADLRAARRAPAPGAGVQVLRARLLHDRRPRLGHRLAHCLALGERAVVVLDTGHHAPGTNIEFIVAQLLRAGRLGAFDFNSRFYADDDLMVGAADPFQLFRIMHESSAAAADAGVRGRLHARPVPQHRGQDPRQIRSVMNVQECGREGAAVDAAALRRRPQQAGDVLGANAVLMDAYDTDVRGRRSPSCASRAGCRAIRYAAYAAVRVRREDRRRAGRRCPGRLGRMTCPTRLPPSTWALPAAG